MEFDIPESGFMIQQGDGFNSEDGCSSASIFSEPDTENPW